MTHTPDSQFEVLDKDSWFGILLCGLRNFLFLSALQENNACLEAPPQFFGHVYIISYHIIDIVTVLKEVIISRLKYRFFKEINVAITL
jgi:hypothetical protein